MKKKAFVIAAIAAIGLSSQAASAKGWTVLAGAKEGYIMDPTISLVAGVSNYKGNAVGIHSTVSGNYGVEFSLNCPLLQPPSNKIRQQLSYVYADGQNDIQLSPHYVVEVAKKLWVGAGPTLGVGFGNSTEFGVGAGASVHYEMGALFLGAEAGYVFDGAESGFGGDSGHNWRTLGKVGFNIR